MKPRDVVRLLEVDGWELVRVRGSHHQFRHPVKKGLVTLAIHGGRDVPARDLQSIGRQSGVRFGKGEV
jgi:predicted RNA binding protein YcfA (HicA-like mRNA interferase family)